MSEQLVSPDTSEDISFYVFCVTCMLILYEADTGDTIQQTVAEGIGWDHWLSYSSQHDVIKVDLESDTACVMSEDGFVYLVEPTDD